MIYSESYSHDVQSLNFWKVCSKTNDSFITLILLTISGDCREALPSFPLQTSPARQCAVLGKPGGRDDRVIVCKRLLSPRPLFVWKFFIFHIISYFANSSGASSARTARPSNFVIILLVRVFIKATVREDRAPFFSYPPTATDETIFSVFIYD